MHFRILITGSREWHPSQAHLIYKDLDKLFLAEGVKVLTVVHGAHWSGVDHFTDLWCRTWQPFTLFQGRDLIPEPHPAAWNTLGKIAGFERNQEMVDLDADLCMAYPLGLSPGTRDCMARARVAGITVWNRTLDLGIDSFPSA